MLDLRSVKEIVILGGGTAGWMSALEVRRIFNPQVNVTVVESPRIGIVGVGEGAILNLPMTLQRHGISSDEFVRQTKAIYKLGFSYEGWRTGVNTDQYFHLFGGGGGKESEFVYNDTFPYVTALVASGIPINQVIASWPKICANAPQAEIKTILETQPKPGFTASYHFDSYAVASFLEQQAKARGVRHLQAEVEQVGLHAESGFAEKLYLNDGRTVPMDFLIDASGLSRVVLGKTLHIRWKSFSEYLLMDRAIPFHMKHPKPNPALVTRALAMNAGWMWQIPLQHRVGAGYVFSSNHISESQAIAEIEQRLGYPVEPLRTLRFEPGHFEQVWHKNILGVGLASGFVEPLEATSIGQMLEQVRHFGEVVTSSGGVFSQRTIDLYNKTNCGVWEGILDFLSMHYDVQRADTSFWKVNLVTPPSPGYKNLKDLWKHRGPRVVDLLEYASNRRLLFGVHSWTSVAQGVGTFSPKAARMDVLALAPENQERIHQFMQQHRNRSSFANLNSAISETQAASTYVSARGADAPKAASS